MKMEIQVSADSPDHNISGGIGGLNPSKGLRNKPFQVVFIEKHNYQALQPLLYQVATGGFEPDSIATGYPNRHKVIVNWAWNYLSYDKDI